MDCCSFSWGGAATPVSAAGSGGLAKALYKGNLEKARRLIEQDRDLHDPLKPSGFTPLMLACEKGYGDIVTLLLDKGADVNARNAGGGTPLYVATYNRHLDIVRLLLDRGAEINAASDVGFTPLMVAAERDQEIARWLLEAGADAMARNETGGTALHVALANGAPEVAGLLLDRGVEADLATAEGWTPLMYAARAGDQDNVRRLVLGRAQVNAQSNAGATPLVLAALEGHEEIVEFLVDRGADVNFTGAANGFSGLMLAASRGHLAVVELLLARGADVNARNADDDNALFVAAVEGHLRVVEALVEAGAEILPATDEAEDSFATSLSYRAWAHRLTTSGEHPSAALAYRTAADHFDTAGDRFEKRARVEGWKAFRRTVAAGLYGALVQYDAQQRAQQMAQLSALRQTADAGGNPSQYYSTLRAYERSLPDSGSGAAPTPSTEEVDTLKQAYSRLAEDSRLAAVASRQEADRLVPEGVPSDHVSTVPIGVRATPRERLENNARLIVYRLQRFGFKTQPEVTLDGAPLAKLVSQKYSEHFVHPGTRKVRSSHSVVTIEAEGGKTYYLRGRLVFNGGGKIESVDERIGAEEVTGLSRVE